MEEPKVKTKIERSFDDAWELVEMERPGTVANLRHMMRSAWIFAVSELVEAERARCAKLARSFPRKHPNDYGYAGAEDIALAIERDDEPRAPAATHGARS